MEKVKQSCLEQEHRCATCAERLRERSGRSNNKRLSNYVISYLRVHPKASIKEMADVFACPEKVIINITSKMEEKGLIEEC